MLIMMLLWWAWTGYAWLANVGRRRGTRSQADDPRSGCRRCSCSRCASPRRSRRRRWAGRPAGAGAGLPRRPVDAPAHVLARRPRGRAAARPAARFAPSVAGSSVVLVIASQTEGHTQTALWGLALVADYVGTWLGGASGWRLPSPGHFSERHGLIVMIALGESIVAIGVGVAGCRSPGRSCSRLRWDWSWPPRCGGPTST